MAVLGGLISLGGYTLLEKKNGTTLGIPQQSTPVQLASMSGLNPSYPDFIEPANKSIHAVVHIKTEYARKNSMYDNFFNFHDLKNFSEAEKFISY